MRERWERLRRERWVLTMLVVAAVLVLKDYRKARFAWSNIHADLVTLAAMAPFLLLARVYVQARKSRTTGEISN